MEIFKLLLNGSSEFQSAHCPSAPGPPPRTYSSTKSNIRSRSGINFLGSPDLIHAHSPVTRLEHRGTVPPTCNQ